MVFNFESKYEYLDKNNIEKIVELESSEYLSSFSLNENFYSSNNSLLNRPFLSGEDMVKRFNEMSESIEQKMLEVRRFYKKAEVNSRAYEESPPLPRPIYDVR